MTYSGEFLPMKHGRTGMMASMSLLALTWMSLCGCSSAPPEVRQYGVMREVMREGRTERRIALAAVVARPHAYAVGAMEGLAGEVTIVDGEVLIARVEEGSLRVESAAPTSDVAAALLTLAHVDRWAEAPLPAAHGRELESHIESAARSLGIDTTRPFPILLEGDAIGLEMHVVNGYCPHGTDPATMNAQPWQWSSESPGRALLVGFYASNAEGVMTHHGSNMHLHAVLDCGQGTITGHVDRVEVGAGTTLRVAAR